MSPISHNSGIQSDASDLQPKATLGPIYLVVFLDMLGFGTIIPVIRDLTLELTKKSGIAGSSELYAGLLMSVYSLFQLLTAPLLGRLSDRYGRKKLLILSVAGNALSYALWAFSGSYGLFLISRIISGATGGNISVAQSYIADVTTKEQRPKAMGIMGALLGIGFILGPMIGGVLSKSNQLQEAAMINSNQFADIGVFACLLSLINLIWIIFNLKEPAVHRLEDSIRKVLNPLNLLSKLNDPKLGRLLLIYFLTQLSFVSFESTFAWVLLHQYNLDTKETGYVFAFMGVVMVIVQGGIYRMLLKKKTVKDLMIQGIAVGIVAMILLPYIPNIWQLIGLNSATTGLVGLGIIVSVLAYGMGVSNPSMMSMASTISDEKDQGLSMGLMQSFGSLARILAPLLATFAYVWYNPTPYLVAGCFMIGALALGVGKKHS